MDTVSEETSLAMVSMSPHFQCVYHAIVSGHPLLLTSAGVAHRIVTILSYHGELHEVKIKVSIVFVLVSETNEVLVLRHHS